MRLKYEKVIHRAIVNNLFGLGYTKKSCNAQGSSKYDLFVTALYILIIPNAFATELNKIIVAKIGQTYLIMKVKIFSRLNGLL